MLRMGEMEWIGLGLLLALAFLASLAFVCRSEETRQRERENLQRYRAVWTPGPDRNRTIARRQERYENRLRRKIANRDRRREIIEQRAHDTLLGVFVAARRLRRTVKDAWREAQEREP